MAKAGLEISDRKVMFMKKIFCTLLVCICVSTCFASHKWDGSVAVPVHRIPVTDERNVSIYPEEASPMPMSTRTTCGACHDYDKISKGFHFNSDPSEKAVEPWVLLDEKAGTQIPVSLRGGVGSWTLNELGLSDWNFTRTFARNMPGGGIGEPDNVFSDSDARWNVSGKLEINCLACHNATRCQDMTEWVKQVSRENFRWAATAASGLGDVSGTASRLSDAWIPSDGFNPDDMTYRVPPAVKYNKSLFDGKHRAFVDVDKPSDKRCLQCHSVAVLGQKKKTLTGDVHTSSGMNCVSCHRNAIDHDISRGDKGEFSCRGCHLGVESADGSAKLGGTYGAPHPKHKGLPPVHIEKLACTVCHSGTWPEEGPVTVRTSRANRLGIHGIAQWYTEAPSIVEPVFMKGADGKIAPYRMMWPSFWAKLVGDKIVPIPADDVMNVAADILNPSAAIGNILAKLSSVTDQSGTGYGKPVFVAAGKVYVRNTDGGLDVLDYEGSSPASGLQFGYIVSNNVEEVIASYDAKDTSAFYYLPAAEREHTMKVLEALSGLYEPSAPQPVWIVDGKLHKITGNDFEVVSNEEAGRMANAVKTAKVLVDETVEKLQIAIVKQGTSIQYYRKGTQEKLYASKEPKLKELKEMVNSLTDAEKAYKELQYIGDKIYRVTAVKNISIEETKLGAAKGAVWGRLDGDNLIPLIPDYAAQFVSDTVGGENVVITEDQVAMTLNRLGAGHAYISNGKMFSLDGIGKLIASDNPSAEPVAWPVGHNVRPASQSLGVRKCTDCHAEDSKFFFGTVVATGPLKTEQGSVKFMNEYMGLDETFHRLFGLSFIVRPLFKVVLLACVLMVLTVLSLYLLLWVKKITEKLNLGLIERLTVLATCLSGVMLALTGFGFAVCIGKSLSGYALLGHTACGGLFAVCMVVLAVLRARANSLAECDANHKTCQVHKICFWLMIICSIVLVLSVLIAMMPVLDTHGQHVSMLIHRYAAALVIIVISLYLVTGRKG